MTPETIQRIAAAVTPAVLLSACGLLALSLDNQAARVSARIRDLAREVRALGAGNPRRDRLVRQIELFDRRHALVTAALLLDYAAAFTFVVTSLLALATAPLPIPRFAPLAVFSLGALLLCGTALLAIAAVAHARRALRIERRELDEPEPR